MNYIPISGGDVLGRGSFGCIVSPAPKCSGNAPDPDMVAKLLFDSRNMPDEVEGYKRMCV